MVNLARPTAATPSYVKVANFPGLYRHARSGRYYACKKLNGIRRDSATALTTGTFSNTPGSLYTDARGDTFLVNYAASVDGHLVPNDVTLTVVTIVPEPSTWAALALAMLLVAACRQSRRSAN